MNPELLVKGLIPLSVDRSPHPVVRKAHVETVATKERKGKEEAENTSRDSRVGRKEKPIGVENSQNC
jgi:hypothetical protein